MLLYYQFLFTKILCVPLSYIPDKPVTYLVLPSLLVSLTVIAVIAELNKNIDMKLLSSMQFKNKFLRNEEVYLVNTN